MLCSCCCLLEPVRRPALAGMTGLLVPVGDERALSTALQVMWSDAEQRGRLARAARDWAQRHAIVKAMVDSYLQLYARLLKP